ncbi:MAG: nuclease [Spartobacteria bacterium]|nr:nuclease [Spartobacteria bacterium]
MVDTSHIEMISTKLRKLEAALAAGSSRKRCLHRWSEFIRERDGHRCVDCHSHHRLAAHHICRKSLLTAAEFQTGNGITLCNSCHKEMHQGFNGRPDLKLPVDAQGGEKLQKMERLYSILTDDAVERDLIREEFYYLSDEILTCFKKMQGYGPETHFPGARIEQAYLILAEYEQSLRESMAEANDVPMPDRPLLPGGMYLVFPEHDGQPRKSIVIQNYKPRWSLDSN